MSAHDRRVGMLLDRFGRVFGGRGVVLRSVLLMVCVVGVFLLDVTVVFASLAPSVDDRPAFASNVSQFSATLNGTIDPHGEPTNYHFIYGLTEAYGLAVPVPDAYVPVNEAEDPVTQVVSRLSPDRTYHFALVADSPAGMTVGPDETLQTPAVPVPVVVTGGVSEATVDSVTLTGLVDPQGWETGYQFQYGPTTAYGSVWPGIPVTLGALTSSQGVISNIQNLQPGTTYHYRLAASDQGGTTYGADQVFATVEYPVSTVAQTPVLSANLGFLNPEPRTGKPAIKSLTRAQKLASALKACKREPKRRRAGCEKRARTRYAPTKKK
ncbi:MAG: hypothetical protein WA484_11025 [Solirubrobacteraceae bacterium]